MSKTKSLLVFLLSFAVPLIVAAQSEKPADLFTQGTQFYIAKDYAKAHESFIKALDQDPYNGTILTNLALTEFQLGKKARAVGYLRKALATDPSLSTAQAGLKFVLSQMQIRDIPHQLETYESLRNSLLQPFPLSAFFILSALTFFASGWILISYGGRRKKSVEQETTMPSFPVIGALLALSFVLFTGLLALKIYDSTINRGTIVEEKVSLQTAPGENQVTILELYEGMEVIAHKSEGDWVQITYPGSLTGWIKKSALLMTR